MKRMTSTRTSAAVLALLLSTPAFAQYVGQVKKQSKDTPQLRAVAVLEWTGEAGKPKQCRLVPISIYDGEKLNDASLYLARPEPIAVADAVEYQLKQNGTTIGLFDVKNAGQEQGSWVGYGEWKQPPKATQPAFAMKAAPIDDPDEDDDKPVLHRKKHPDEDSKSAGTTKSTSVPAAADDPDRPKLHKKDDSPKDSSSSGDVDTDRPTIHRRSGTDTAANTPAADPDRPTMKKSKKDKTPEDIGHVESLPQITDPDRPRLLRGKSNADSIKVVPSLMGLPPEMQQAVAVSDAQNHPDHPWTYSWANPDDQWKMKAQLEDIARQALGLTPPPPPPAPKTPKTYKRRTAAARKTAPPPSAPAEPEPLRNEKFRVFELSYGAGATMVLTAETGGDLAHEKFVTLIAQPDLYGNVQVLFKNLADGAHLDETPQMRLVDAVDALSDNRGELLFELRGQTQRQFVLYRVLRGQVDKLFASGGGDYGSFSTE